MRKIAIFYLDPEGWIKAMHPEAETEPITADQYRFLCEIVGPSVNKMNLENIWAAFQNVDSQNVFNAANEPDRSMVIGDAVLLSDGPGHCDGYVAASVGFTDINPDMTLALANIWLAQTKANERTELLTSRVIFDNAGGVTFQTVSGYAHHYDDPARAAQAFCAYLAGADTDDWEGNDPEAALLNPSFEDIQNGCYKVFLPSDLIRLNNDVEEYSWGNVRLFINALRTASLDLASNRL